MVVNNTLQLKFSSICFYCIISSKPWGGGADLIILVICTFWGVRGGGGVQGYLFIPCTKTKKTRRLLSLSTKFFRQRTRSKTIKLISLLCLLHRKKTQTIKPFFHLNSQKISLAFSFLTIPQNQPINLFIIKYYNHSFPPFTDILKICLAVQNDQCSYHFLPVCF